MLDVIDRLASNLLSSREFGTMNMVCLVKLNVSFWGIGPYMSPVSTLKIRYLEKIYISIIDELLLP